LTASVYQTNAFLLNFLLIKDSWKKKASFNKNVAAWKNIDIQNCLSSKSSSFWGIFRMTLKTGVMMLKIHRN